MGKIYEQQLNILTAVLDDDKDTLDMLKELFLAEGFVNANFYTDTLEFINNIVDNLHICVLDYWLDARYNGLEVMDIVLEKSPHCHVILVTGNKDLQVVEDFINKGGFRIVNKSNKNYMLNIAKYVNQALSDIREQIEYHNKFEEKIQEITERTKLRTANE